MSYLVLARKWRPQRFSDVVGQKHVSLTLSNALKTGRLSHAYLFAGPRGVGKTSVARILAKALNCEKKGPASEPCNKCEACRSITEGHCLDVLEIDGASNRGIDDVRQLRESVKYAPASVRTKVYIIDEVHMLTTDAFNALLKTLEEPPRHVCFMLATTEPLKVLPTILSRCQRFDFGRLTVDEMLANLRKIVAAEEIEVDDEGLRLLARKAEGSVRDSLTLLDQVAATGAGPFDAVAIQAILGLSGSGLYFELSDAVTAGDAPRALACLQRAYEEGLNLQEVAEELVHHFRNVLLMSLGEGLEEILEATPEETAQLSKQVRNIRPAEALRWLRIMLDAAARMRRSAHGRVHLEVALVEMAALPRSVDLGSVLEKLRKDMGGSAKDSDRSTRAGTGPARAPGGSTETGDSSGRAGGDSTRAAGVADADQQAAWDRVLSKVRGERAFLGSCLHDSRAVGIDNGRVLVVLDDINGFKRDQVEKPANRRFVLRIMEEVFGRSVGFRLVNDADAPKRDVPKRVDASAGSASSAVGGASAVAERVGETQPDRAPQPRGGQTESATERVRKIAEMMNGDIIGPTQ
jgi:DNA polymerase-3 subunit gamma/tau